MAVQREDIATKISTQAAEDFVYSFYRALNSSRATIASFFIPAAVLPTGKTLPTIVFNGNTLPDAPALQTMYDQHMPETHYEVLSYDCQVLNPNVAVDGVAGVSGTHRKKMSILVLVSGSVKMGKPNEAKLQGFSEALVLVPNPNAFAVKGRTRNVKEWLIQSDHFRLVS